MIRSQRTPLVQRRIEKSEHERNVASIEETKPEEKKEVQERAFKASAIIHHLNGLKRVKSRRRKKPKRHITTRK